MFAFQLDFPFVLASKEVLSLLSICESQQSKARAHIIYLEPIFDYLTSTKFSEQCNLHKIQTKMQLFSLLVIVDGSHQEFNSFACRTNIKPNILILKVDRHHFSGK